MMIRNVASSLPLIEDSLDNKIDESLYHLPEIGKVLTHIQRSDVTPEEKARMIEESYSEQTLLHLKSTP